MGLKALLKRKFGGSSKVVEAVEKWSRTRSERAGTRRIGKEAAKSGANQDQELIAAAEAVLAKLKELPADAQQHIQSAIGSYIAQADRGSTAKVIVNRKE